MKRYDGSIATGRAIGEMHGELCAMIAAVAKGVEIVASALAGEIGGEG